MGADDTGWDEWGVGAAVDESDVVFGAVEGGPNVVTHAAVDANVAAGFAAVNGDVFDGADGVDGDGAGSSDGPAGFHLDERHGQVESFGVGVDSLQEVGGDGFDVEGLFTLNIGDAIAATEVEDIELLPYLAFFNDGAVELEDAFRGQGEAFGVEHLGADVAVEADEPEVGEFDDAPGGFEGGAGGEGEAEFLVFVGGGDEFVGVGVDAGFDADEDVLGLAEFHGDGVEVFDFLVGVKDNEADAFANAVAEEGCVFVIAVGGDAFGGESGVEGDEEFAV